MPYRLFSKLSRALLGGALLGSVASGCLNWSELENGACGDGILGREEACDDGNLISGDGCSDACRVEPAVCGNGRRETGENCDDANGSNNDECVNDCKFASCGDGLLFEFDEACDDGNTIDGDGCSSKCALEPQISGPRCGDGTVDSDEVCDDGNSSNFDACLNGCSFATCGDGYVRQGVEECDYGKSDSTCTHGCMLCGNTPGSYFRAGNAHCYTAHANATSETQARRICQAEGGDLWTVTSDAESADVTGKLSLMGQLWLGLITNGSGSSWVSGENTKYTSFAAGEPSDTALRCVTFDAASPTGAWRSEACSAKLAYVCERSPAFGFPDTHHAYRLHTEQLDAESARERCMTDGGYLAALQTAGERASVGKNVNLTVWVDARDAAVDNQFVWSSGEPVEPWFAAGQPDDTNGSQGCLLLNPGDKYADADCTEPHAFICELE